MSFFKKSNPGPQLEVDADNIAISSVVGKGMTLIGDISFTGKLRMDGKVEGNVKGEHLILGETGSITGDIEIDTCSCQGRVNGNIKAKDLSVVKGCRIDGNVETVNLAVEPGAFLNGEVKVEANDLRLVKGNSSQQEEEAAPSAKSG